MLKFLGLQLAGWTISNEEAVSEKETLYFASSFFSLVLDQLTLGWERGVPVDAWAPSRTWRCAPDLWWQGLVLSALPCCSISRSTAAENQVYGTSSHSGWWKTFFFPFICFEKITRVHVWAPAISDGQWRLKDRGGRLRSSVFKGSEHLNLMRVKSFNHIKCHSPALAAFCSLGCWFSRVFARLVEHFSYMQRVGCWTQKAKSPQLLDIVVPFWICWAQSKRAFVGQAPSSLHMGWICCELVTPFLKQVTALEGPPHRYEINLLKLELI